MLDMYKKRLPTRARSHVSESKSHSVITLLLEEQWIVRDLTERDYGIDLIIERVEENESVTGKLAVIQLKSIKNIEFDKNYDFRYYKVKPTSTDYWLNSNLPAFVFIVDSDGEAYFKNVGDHVRKNYQRYINKDRFYYSFSPKDKYEKNKFIKEFDFEDRYELTEGNIVNFAFLYRELSELFHYYKRDPYMTVDGSDERIKRLTSLQYRMDFISKKLGFNKGCPSLENIANIHEIYDHSEIYEHHYSLMLEVLDELSIDLIKEIKAKFLEPYNFYFHHKDYIFSRFIETASLEKFKDRYRRRLENRRK